VQADRWPIPVAKWVPSNQQNGTPDLGPLLCLSHLHHLLFPISRIPSSVSLSAISICIKYFRQKTSPRIRFNRFSERNSVFISNLMPSKSVGSSHHSPAYPSHISIGASGRNRLGSGPDQDAFTASGSYARLQHCGTFGSICYAVDAPWEESDPAALKIAGATRERPV
jgi:hypothetical protein